MAMVDPERAEVRRVMDDRCDSLVIKGSTQLYFSDFEIIKKRFKNDHRKTAIVLSRGLSESSKDSKTDGHARQSIQNQVFTRRCV